MAKFTKEELKNIPVHICPNEENGTVISISTIDLTGEEFTELRLKHNNGVSSGASETSVWKGNDGYDRTPLELYEEKTSGKPKEINAVQAGIFQLGHDFEPIGASVFCQRNKLELYRPSGMLYCAAEPGIYVNVDYIAHNPVTDEWSIVEMKNVNGREHKREIRRRYSEGLSAEPWYETQVRQQMYVTGLTKGYVVYCWAESPYGLQNFEIEELYAFPVAYDEADMMFGVDVTRKALEAIEKRDKTLLLDLPSATPKDFTILYGKGEGELAPEEVNAEWLDAIDNYCRALRSEECAKAEREEAEKEIRRLLAGKEKAVIQSDMFDAEITTKTRVSKTWDLPRLYDVAPDVYAEGISFSITEAKLKKLEESVKETVLSCLTTVEKPVAGINIKVNEK